MGNNALTAMGVFMRYIKVRRFQPGTWLKGEYTPGSYEEFVVKGVVQPAKPDDLIELPEGERMRQAIRIYTVFPLQGPNGDVKGDQIDVDGTLYEVKRIMSYTSAYGMEHYKVIAVRVEGQ